MKLPAKIALVAEGGAMRSIFTAGVLDVFHEESFDPFDLYYGVSAGANNLSSFLARQHRRNYEVITELATRPEFISITRFLKGGHLMDIEWLWETMFEHHPLDVPTAVKNTPNREFNICCSSLDTGLPMYLRPGLETWEHFLKASSAIPLYYRDIVEINHHRVTDGAVCDPIPVMEAYHQGARLIVTIRTRPVSFRKKKGSEHWIEMNAFKDFPRFRLPYRRQITRYNEICEFIANPPNCLNILQIAPPDELNSGRATKKLKKLNADYELGRIQAHWFLRNYEGLFRALTEDSPSPMTQASINEFSPSTVNDSLPPPSDKDSEDE